MFRFVKIYKNGFHQLGMKAEKRDWILHWMKASSISFKEMFKGTKKDTERKWRIFKGKRRGLWMAWNKKILKEDRPGRWAKQCKKKSKVCKDSQAIQDMHRVSMANLQNNTEKEKYQKKESKRLWKTEKIVTSSLLLRFKKYWRCKNVLPAMHLLDFAFHLQEKKSHQQCTEEGKFTKEEVFIPCSPLLCSYHHRLQ